MPCPSLTRHIMKKNIVLASNQLDSVWCEVCLDHILPSVGFDSCILNHQCFSDDPCPHQGQFHTASISGKDLTQPLAQPANVNTIFTKPDQ